MPVQKTSEHPVVVIGAGPVGLAAAAHLAIRGLPFLVLEAGKTVASNLQSYRHVRLFSPWRFNIDRAAREILQAEAWQAPDDEGMPTAGEIVDAYLEPLARTFSIRPHLRFGKRVKAVSREGFDKVKTRGRESAPFVLQVQTENGVEELRASAVVDASGTWGQPNPLGVHGLTVPGEIELANQIRYGMPDILGAERARYAGKTVVVVGSGHSAAGNLIALAELAELDAATRLIWAVRGSNVSRVFGGGSKDGLPARGQLGTRLQQLVAERRLVLELGFGIAALERRGGKIQIRSLSGTVINGVDEIVSATGARPDLRLSQELRVRQDPWLESTDALAPLIDPNEHSCGTVRPHGHRELAHPEPGFYAIGAKSYGRAPNFLMTTGYEQARSVVAGLAGDWAAADEVQLELPETGVCSVDLGVGEGAAESCCSASAAKDVSACGAPDRAAKVAGVLGCGGEAPSGALVRCASSCGG